GRIRARGAHPPGRRAARDPQPGAGGGIYRQPPDQHRAVPVQLGAVGGARSQRGAPVLGAGRGPGAAGHGRLRRAPPARGQPHRGRPHPQPPRGPDRAGRAGRRRGCGPRRGGRRGGQERRAGADSRGGSQPAGARARGTRPGGHRCRVRRGSRKNHRRIRLLRVWATAHPKGGVGKTTTTLALGRGLATRGSRVLLVDLDPHSSLTRTFGVPADPAPEGVMELFATPPRPLASLARTSAVERLDYVCAQTALATLERRSANQPGLGLALAQALARHAGQHDYVLLDCPPTLGLLMINALAAADRAIIPTQAEPLALHGLAGMRRTAEMVERSRRRPLPVSVLPTLYDRRTRAGQEALK